MQASLKKLVNGFGESPLLKGKAMRELLESDREGFRSAAIPLLKSVSDERGCRYLITLLWTNDLLIEAFCDDAALPLEQAVSVARAAARVDPQLHIRLLRHLLEGLETGADQAHAGEGRLLEILSAITDRGSVLPLLTQLLRHPNPHIRSKVALLIGRSNKSAKWLEKRMAEADPRVRANAVEALWGVEGVESRAILWGAVKDGHNRVAGNALVGLYRTGDANSIPVFIEMAENPDPLFRTTAAWAMGETEDPRFVPVLGRMLADAQGGLRKTVFHAINKIKNGHLNGSGGPPLCVAIVQARRAAEASKLRVIVSDAEAQPLTRLSPTGFIIWEEGAPVSHYSVEEHSAPDALAIGFALPRRVENGDAYRLVCEESLLACLENKRKADLWCILKYSEHDPGRPGGNERLFGQDMSAPAPATGTGLPEISVSANVPVLRTAIEGTGTRFEMPQGLLPAAQRFLEGMASIRGSRHLILLQDQSSPADSNAIREMLSTARKARITVHAISLSADPALGDLCADSGGTFRQAEQTNEVRGLIENLYASLLSHYKLKYRSEAIHPPESSMPLRLQIITPQGGGEASIQAT